MNKKFIAIILAAGEGTRMKSSLPKVLHTICGKRMLEYSLELVRQLNTKCVAIISDKQKAQIKPYLPKEIKIACQKLQKGTADAVKCAQNLLKNFSGNILIIYADNPLLRSSSLKTLLKAHLNSCADCTLLTAVVDNPSGYGRIIRDNFSNVIKIVEDKDANIQEKAIREINTGIFCFKKQALFANLGQIKSNNKKNEHYLTDLVAIFREKGLKVESCILADPEEALGVNSRKDLAIANKICRFRIMEGLLEQGITIVDPKNTYIDLDTNIGQDTIIYPFTVIENNVKIGKNCCIGPFCRLRSGTVLADNVEVGNFIEINRSKIDKQTKAKHFGYLGDCIIGKKVNIGAGTVTANYDGENKNITRIQNGAFIGSDTVIVAPAKIGKCAVTGAGSVVLKNKSIADNTVVAGVPARLLKKEKK